MKRFPRPRRRAVAGARARDRIAGDSRRGGRRGSRSANLVHTKVAGAVHDVDVRPRVGETYDGAPTADGGCDRTPWERSP